MSFVYKKKDMSSLAKSLGGGEFIARDESFEIVTLNVKGRKDKDIVSDNPVILDYLDRPNLHEEIKDQHVKFLNRRASLTRSFDPVTGSVLVGGTFGDANNGWFRTFDVVPLGDVWGFPGNFNAFTDLEPHPGGVGTGGSDLNFLWRLNTNFFCRVYPTHVDDPSKNGVAFIDSPLFKSGMSSRESGEFITNKQSTDICSRIVGIDVVAIDVDDSADGTSTLCLYPTLNLAENPYSEFSFYGKATKFEVWNFAKGGELVDPAFLYNFFHQRAETAINAILDAMQLDRRPFVSEPHLWMLSEQDVNEGSSVPLSERTGGVSVRGIVGQSALAFATHFPFHGDERGLYTRWLIGHTSPDNLWTESGCHVPVYVAYTSYIGVSEVRIGVPLFQSVTERRPSKKSRYIAVTHNGKKIGHHAFRDTRVGVPFGFDLGTGPRKVARSISLGPNQSSKGLLSIWLGAAFAPTLSPSENKTTDPSTWAGAPTAKSLVTKWRAYKALTGQAYPTYVDHGLSTPLPFGFISRWVEIKDLTIVDGHVSGEFGNIRATIDAVALVDYAISLADQRELGPLEKQNIAALQVKRSELIGTLLRITVPRSTVADPGSVLTCYIANKGDGPDRLGEQKLDQPGGGQKTVADLDKTRAKVSRCLVNMDRETVSIGDGLSDAAISVYNEISKYKLAMKLSGEFELTPAVVLDDVDEYEVLLSLGITVHQPSIDHKAVSELVALRSELLNNTDVVEVTNKSLSPADLCGKLYPPLKLSIDSDLAVRQYFALSTMVYDFSNQALILLMQNRSLQVV